jgi:3D (Asp-Asp-Asp) domain-containing protein
MRIISIIASLPMLWAMLFPQHALANEIINTNTKIEFETDSILSKIDKKIPYNFEGYIPEKVRTLEEIQSDKILAKWEEKRKKADFPKGNFIVNASAYTAAADECGKSDGITASGLKVKEKRTLACPPSYPFGIKVKIEGVGTLVCEDRGGAIKGNHFDIYVETKKEAFAFGRRNLLAEVVE